MVGRVYGFADGKTSVLLPDGQIGFTSGMAETDEPFRPATFEKGAVNFYKYASQHDQ